MTLLIALACAAIATALWYVKAPDNSMRFGVLALMYWGAALMWMVDGIACLAEGEAFIEIIDPAVMFDDAMLGLLVAVIGVAAWAVYLAVKDPKHVLRKALTTE